MGFLPLGADGTPGAPSPADPEVVRRGLLEEATAADGVVRTAQAMGMAGASTAEGVFAAARARDQVAQAVVRLEGERLASLIATIAAILDPELIVLGGGVGRNLDLLQEPLEERLHALTPLRPRIAVSALGNDAVLLGAIATGLELARDLVFQRRAGDGRSAAEAGG